MLCHRSAAVPTSHFACYLYYSTADSLTAHSTTVSSSHEVAATDEFDPVRDKSRLKRYHRLKMKAEIIPLGMFQWQNERKHLKARYAEYGRECAVEPGLMWPSRQELDVIKDEDELFNPKLHETIAEVRRKAAELAETRKAQLVEVENKIKEYPKVLEAHRQKLLDQQEELDRDERQKREKVQKIQEHFGYAVSPDDPRFVAMMEKMQMEERKAAKSAKVKDQRAKLVAQLQATADALRVVTDSGGKNS